MKELDYEPIKCSSCGCDDLETFDIYYDEFGEVEYSVRCLNCGKQLGTWSYGKWFGREDDVNEESVSNY